jgi:hypothetical protein
VSVAPPTPSRPIGPCARCSTSLSSPDLHTPPATRASSMWWWLGSHPSSLRCRDTTKYGHRGAIMTSLGPGRIPAGNTSRSALYVRSSFSLRLPQALFINASPSTRSRKLYKSHRQSSWLWVVDLRRRYYRAAVVCLSCVSLPVTAYLTIADLAFFQRS